MDAIENRLRMLFSENRNISQSSPKESSSNRWSSSSNKDETTEFIELNRPRKWFTSKDSGASSTLVERNRIWSYTEKKLFGELPEDKTVTTNVRYYKDVEVKLSEEERQAKRAELKLERELDLQLEREAEEIGHKKFFKFIESDTCECGVSQHPSKWSDFMIERVHCNLYRICYKGLKVDDGTLIHDLGDLKLIRIVMGEQTPWVEKIKEFLIYVDIELGYEGCTHRSKEEQVYLVLDEVHIVGCAVVEPIKFGRKMSSPLKGNPTMGRKLLPVDCGVNRIWVFLKYRRKGIATVLLETVRRYFRPGEMILRNNIAFAEPNLLGRHFAAAYCRQNNFVVY